MFTGIIKYLGKVEQVIERPFGRTITISSPEIVKDLNIDDSVAVNGVCLTATSIDKAKSLFLADIVHTSLEKTTLKNISPGQSVHLELAAQLMDRLGGHLVQGHVQGIGIIKSIHDKGGNFDVEIALPKHLMNYQVDEGPLVIDGVSMTVAKCHPESSSVTITVIPHTWDRTLLSTYQVGSAVNIEADLIAQYVYKFTQKLRMDNIHER